MRTWTVFLVECRQLHQVVVGHRLKRFSGFPPGRKSADDDKRVEAFFPQLQRHPGAGRFALSSTVQIDIFAGRKVFQFLGKIVGFETNRTFDSLRFGIVVAMAADVDHQDIIFV